jgi:8-oxo-dGTP pyrophosphatase MutT (NUDIX family)/phosphohistidine phosphatase SixA
VSVQPSPSTNESPGDRQDAGHGPRTGLVRAAGAVCWRHDPHGGLEVLLVHRPRYDDWSWPKGKLDEGEAVAAAAAREVEEETGLRVRLGVPLPPARYRLAEGLDKHVAYWAAHVQDGALPPPPRPDEVDRTEWVTPTEAARRLTRRGDRVQLQALESAAAEGALDTFPVVVLRHGHAYPRSAWGRDDAERPLAAAGVRQAEALVPLLLAWGPERVYSSPWARCVESVRPYLVASGARLRTKSRLSEEGHRRDPAKVSHLVTTLLAKRRPVLVCTHRPVLGTLLGTLAGHNSAGVAGDIPRSDPFLELGELLVAHVSRRTTRVVAVERHAADATTAREAASPPSPVILRSSW